MVVDMHFLPPHDCVEQLPYSSWFKILWNQLKIPWIKIFVIATFFIIAVPHFEVEYLRNYSSYRNGTFTDTERIDLCFQSIQDHPVAAKFLNVVEIQ